MAAMRVESSRLVKAQQRMEEDSRREALANNKLQYEMVAKMKESREQLDREARRSDSQMRIESIRQRQLTKRLEESSQRASLENARLQYAFAADVRAAIRGGGSAHYPQGLSRTLNSCRCLCIAVYFSPRQSDSSVTRRRNTR
jgi:hypothetical protein